MSLRKYLFLDRDGTLIEEPADFQVDSVEKFRLVAGVVPALVSLRDAGYRFVMVSNQDGLGSERYPRQAFDRIQALLLGVLESQGIFFESIRICPHREDEGCPCRKPGLGLLRDFAASEELDRKRSCVIGDRQTDLLLAENLGVRGVRISRENGWKRISEELLLSPRTGACVRRTRETAISARVRLDCEPEARVATGIGFFDHMLEQISKHGGIALSLEVQGDLGVDDHHTIEDAGLAFGAALREALGDKSGIGRYGYSLPMDDAAAHVLLDLSGRSFFRFEGSFGRERVGELSTEMVPHFFRSFADGLGANLHIRIEGENTHHQIESAFKCLGRALRQAVRVEGPGGIPSTKGGL